MQVEFICIHTILAYEHVCVTYWTPAWRLIIVSQFETKVKSSSELTVPLTRNNRVVHITEDKSLVSVYQRL